MSFQPLPGERCVYDQKLVQMDRMDNHSYAFVKECATGIERRAHVAQLKPLPKKSQGGELTEPDEAEWERCSRVATALNHIRTEGRVPRTAMLKAAERCGVSLRTMQRYKARYSQCQSVSGLNRKKRGRQEGTVALPQATHEAVMHVIRKHYLRRERPSMTYAVERAQALCRKLGIPVPSRKAVVRRIHRLDAYRTQVARHGSKAAKQKLQPRPGALEVSAPMEMVQMDHTVVDLMVWTDDTRARAKRPWITLAIDVYSRCVVGFYLTFDAPNATSVSMCIENMVLPKDEDLEQPGYWPMYGLPKVLHVDNGKDLTSMALQRGCAEHMIEIQWRPIATPHYGAHIERLNGTLMRLCHLLPGTTMSNIAQRGDYKSEENAKFTLEELRLWLLEKICRYYHLNKHRGIGNTSPLLKWEEGMRDAMGNPLPPKTVADPENFRVNFLPMETRKVHRYGFWLKNSRYWHADLIPYICLRHVVVHFDPRALGSVWLRRDDGTLLEVPAVAGPATGKVEAKLKISAERHAAIQGQVDAHFEKCDDLEKKARQATRKAAAARKSPPRSNQQAAAPAAAAAPLPPVVRPEVVLPPSTDVAPPAAPPAAAIPDLPQGITSPLKAPVASPFEVMRF